MPDAPAPDAALHAALQGVRALLLDLDGVLVLKGKAVPGAVDAMNELERRGFPYLVLTNTSLVSRSRLAGWGRKVGFNTPVDRFMSALSASAEIARREYADRPIFVIASADARTELAGLNVVAGEAVDADPAAIGAVILGDSPDELTKENLDRAFRCLMTGAELLGMHRNPWWLTPAGPTLDAGAFLVGLEWAAGRRARIVGKPSPTFFAGAIRRMAAEAAARGEPQLLRSEIAMVGDDVGSDIGGGRRAGLRTVFVHSGKHGDAELEAVAARRRFPYAPDAVGPSIAEVVAALR
ncbi:MAG TPA: HAD-IIA family hydrolase [Candidatus Limnocylindrales bacterium]|nr:HAD-IIA family hydrolase [Candidatus Limnocylindrales bacterium]